LRLTGPLQSKVMWLLLRDMVDRYECVRAVNNFGWQRSGGGGGPFGAALIGASVFLIGTCDVTAFARHGALAIAAAVYRAAVFITSSKTPIKSLVRLLTIPQ